jgi:hypothetical protein
MQRLIFCFIILFQSFAAFADEGMWLPIWLQSRDIEKMQKMGLEVPFDELYNQSKPSLKDAVVALDNGSCTAELVSADGLLLTNHHCGMDEIQAHSSLEHDYLKNGFWAKDKSEELSNPGKTATLLISATEITQWFAPHLNLTDNEAQRIQMIDSLTAVFEAEVRDTSKYEAKIVSFYKQNRFVLFLTQTYKDVRLVGAPQVGIGNFGGEVDNWVWPRHTGDFSIFRIYTAPDGSPAEYSPNNVPFHPKKFLKVSANGYQPNSFTMIMGYPGTTNRYATSAEITTIYEAVNPLVNEIRKIKQNVLKAEMIRSPEIAIQYAAKYDHSANYQKYALGQNEGIKRLKLIEMRQQFEKSLLQLSKDDEDTAFVNQFNALSNSFYLTQQVSKANTLIEEALFQGSDLVQFTFKYLDALFTLRQMSTSDEGYNDKRQALIDMVNTSFKDYNANLDKKVMVAMLEYIIQHQKQGDIQINLIPKKFKNDPTAYANWLYMNTVFTDQKALLKYISEKIPTSLRKDPMIEMIGDLFSQYSSLADTLNTFENQQQVLGRQYIDKLIDLYPDSSFYPDANSTMRLTYGKVEGYNGRDAVVYNHYTTLKGVIEKGKQEEVAEYKVPEKVKELYQKQDYGNYGDHNQLNTCFLTTNDITGGNSGSPVMNGKGELIGLAFDGNWEAMTSDLAYSDQYQRTICVDIRYVLWVIEKIGQDTRLINEMEIVR